MIWQAITWFLGICFVLGMLDIVVFNALNVHKHQCAICAHWWWHRHDANAATEAAHTCICGLQSWKRA